MFRQSWIDDSYSSWRNLIAAAHAGWPGRQLKFDAALAFQAVLMARAITVLVVDDERSVRQGITALLSLSADLEVIGEASNGQEAIRIVSDIQPDVVLMDIRMPVTDGLEATRIIKARWPDVKVIVFTMFDAEEADAIAAGADCFLLKGNPRTVLEDIIHQHGKPNRTQV